MIKSGVVWRWQSRREAERFVGRVEAWICIHHFLIGVNVIKWDGDFYGPPRSSLLVHLGPFVVCWNR